MTPIMCIYRITNLPTGKFYIGSTNNYAHRKRQHLHYLISNTHGNAHLQSAWNKYGPESFTFDVLERLECRDDLVLREQYWLESLHVCDRLIGYNVSLQANRSELAPETKRKIGLANRGRHPSPEARLRIGLASKGRAVSPETREKIREASTGRRLSDEARNKIRMKQLGTHHSPERRLQNSLVHLGSHLTPEHKQKLLNANLGRKNTENQIINMRVAAKKRSMVVIQYSLNGEFIREFESLHDVQRLGGFSLQNVHSVCKGKSKTACGFKWKYKA